MDSWTVWTMSMDTLDKVWCVHGQSPVRPARLDNVHGFRGHCPRTQFTLSMDSVDSLDIVHGHPGQSPAGPGGLDNVHGQCPLSPKIDWTLSMDSLDKVQSDLVKKMKLK